MVARQPFASFASSPRHCAARWSRSLALLLLLVQALVVPAHRHAGPVPSIAAAGSHVAAPAKSRPDHPAECPVCREVAHAGQYLTPGEVRLPMAPAGTLAPVVAALASLDTDARSHAWRSRAPPVFRQS